MRHLVTARPATAQRLWAPQLVVHSFAEHAVAARRLKDTSSEYDPDVQRIADAIAPDLLHRLLNAFIEIEKHLLATQLASAIRAKDAEAIFRMLEDAGLSDDLAEEVDRLREAFGQAGDIAAQVLSSRLPIAYTFDFTLPRAARLARTQGANLVVEISDDQKDVIRQLIASGIEDGRTVDDTAIMLRSSVGLNSRLTNAVINYSRTLADSGMSASKVTAKSSAYAKQLLRYRTRSISITETQRAVHAGQREAWDQAADKHLFNRHTAERVWIADPGACENCAFLNGTTLPYDQEFDGPPLHPYCRCDEQLRFHE